LTRVDKVLTCHEVVDRVTRGQRRVTLIELEGVVPGAAEERVGADAADDEVVADAAADDVVACLAVEGVGA